MKKPALTVGKSRFIFKNEKVILTKLNVTRELKIDNCQFYISE